MILLKPMPLLILLFNPILYRISIDFWSIFELAVTWELAAAAASLSVSKMDEML